MANIKNFGLAGISSDVQFGKSGGRLVYDSSSSFFKFTTDGTTLTQIRAASPSNSTDVATKSYVDATKQGLDVKDSVRAATTGNITIASDLNVLPYGTVLYIPDYGWGQVEDIGSAIKGNHIDLFFNSHNEALKWGRKTKIVHVWLPHK